MARNRGGRLLQRSRWRLIASASDLALTSTTTADCHDKANGGLHTILTTSQKDRTPQYNRDRREEELESQTLARCKRQTEEWSSA